MTPDRDALYGGDWRTMPQHCTGVLEVWDQTLGCTECNANLWNTPGDTNTLPVWAQPQVPPSLGHDAWQDHLVEMFYDAHPWVEGDGHDPGDEDDGDNWDGNDLIRSLPRGNFPWEPTA